MIGRHTGPTGSPVLERKSISALARQQEANYNNCGQN